MTREELEPAVLQGPWGALATAGVMTKKYGENWADCKQKAPESAFELQKKRFHSEPPKVKARIGFS